MKKLICAVGVVYLLFAFSQIGEGWEALSGWGPGNELKLSGYKYHYFPIGYGGSSTSIKVGGDANDLPCVGLAGTEQTGSTTGYVTMKEDTDTLRFRFRLPQTFVDTGIQEDLVLEFYVSEQITTNAITYDVSIYEFLNDTAILTDQFTVKGDTAAGWVGLVTNSTGIGNDSDIDGDDVLIVEISPQTAAPQGWHTANIYGCRLKYRTGLYATE